MAASLPRVSLRLLGPVQIQHNGDLVEKLGSQKSLLLLAYLIRHPQEHSRAKLASLLWIDQPQSKARSNLRWALNNLSKFVPDTISATRQTLQFHSTSSLWVDLEQFDLLSASINSASTTTNAATGTKTVGPRALSQVTDLYRGDFLEGITAEDAPDLELWLFQEREYWRQRAGTLLEQLIQGYIAEQQYYHAERIASQLLRLEPWREETHRQLMWLLAVTDRPSAALTQFETCRQILADELAVDPTAATVALYEQIRQQTMPSRSVSAPFASENDGDGAANGLPGFTALSSISTENKTATLADWGEAPLIREFYGRQAEVQQLTDWVIEERARFVLVQGMGGMGKTALVTHVARQLAQHFAVVSWRSLVNAPTVGEVIRGWVQSLSAQRLHTWPEALDDQIRILIRFLQEQRTLLILDNVESILLDHERAGNYRPGFEGYGQLLQAIGSGAHQSCLLLTSREQPQKISALIESSGSVRIMQLQGLDLDAGRALLTDRGLADSPATESALVARASGSPMALRVIAETIHDLFGGDIGAFLNDATFVFDDLRDMLEQQRQRLTPLELAILLWSAIEREGLTVSGLQSALVPSVSRHLFIEMVRSLERRSLLDVNNGLIHVPTVVIEHMTTFLVSTICEEIVQEEPELLLTHALMKALAKTYIREVQNRLIVQPILRRLETKLGRTKTVEKLRNLLALMRTPALPSSAHLARGHYGGGNVLNLLIAFEQDLTNWDFSHLSIRQAHLRNVQLPPCTFHHADFSECSFTDAFGLVHAVAFHPSGQELAATAEHEIRFWRDPDGQRTTVLRGHTDDVWSIAFDPDGTMLVSGAWDHSVRLWDLATHKTIRTMEGHTKGVTAVAISPDGMTIASGSYDQTIRLWDLHTGLCQRELCGHTEWVWSVAFSPDGGLLASAAGDHTVRLWQIRNGEALALLEGHTDQVWSVAFSPDGRQVASAGNDGLVLVWDLRSRTILHTMRGHTGWVRSLCYTPDGTILISGSNDGTVRFWSAKSGLPVKTLHGHRNAVNSVAVSQSGYYVASGSNDQSIRIWELLSGQTVQEIYGYTNWVRSVVIGADGRTIVSGSDDGKARLWHIDLPDITNLDNINSRPEDDVPENDLPEDDFPEIAVDAGSALQPVRYFVGHRQMVRHVALSHDSLWLATASADGTICLWESATGTLLQTLNGHRGWVSSVTWSPPLPSAGDTHETNIAEADFAEKNTAEANVPSAVGGIEQTLLSSSWDGTICLWDGQRGEPIRTLQSNEMPVYTAIFHPAGHLIVSGGADRMIRFWDAQSGAHRGFLRGHVDDVRTLAFSADGSWLVSGGEDGTVWLWQAKREQTGANQAGKSRGNGRGKSVDSGEAPTEAAVPYRFIHKWDEFEKGVRSVAITADGHWIAAAGDDGIILLWERVTTDRIQQLTGHGAIVWSIAFAPDGEQLGSGSADGTLRIWDCRSGRCEAIIPLPGPYSGVNIAQATGLTAAQRETLKTLGAIERTMPLDTVRTALSVADNHRDRTAAKPTVGTTASPQTEPLRHNLPREQSPFVGRQSEVMHLRELILEGSRPLVTLIGEGGVGKSRLALEVARTLVTQSGEQRQERSSQKFRDGIWFVPLAGIDGQQTVEPLLIRAIADAVQLHFGGSQPPLHQLLDYLRHKDALLLLDNMEHLVEGSLLLSDLLAEAPGIQMVATSRIPLELQEEWRYHLLGMDLPEPNLSEPNEVGSVSPDLATLRQNGSVALFLQNAQRIDRTFALTAENQQAVITICRRLYGLPLALELAATGLMQMSCQALAAQLEQMAAPTSHHRLVNPEANDDGGLDLLQSSFRNIPERHRTMRNVFAYSWQLLTPQEQQAAMQLATFRGGGEPDALLAVTEFPLETIVALSRKSLIQRDNHGRYVMHELLRQFCLEQLADLSDPLFSTAVWNRHTTYYLQHIQATETAIKGYEPQSALAPLRRDLDNVRQAWQWALQSHHWSLVEQSVSALSRFYLLAGLLTEGHHALVEAKELLVQVLQSASSTATSSIHTKVQQLLYLVLVNDALFCNALADYDAAVAAVQDAIALTGHVEERLKAHDFTAEKIADPDDEPQIALASTVPIPNTAAAYLRWGEALWYKGEIEAAQPHLVQTLSLVAADTTMPDARRNELRADALCLLGLIAVRKGDYATAINYYEESHGISDALADAYRAGRALYSLGTAYRNQAHYGEARRYLAQGLTIARQTGDHHSESRVLNSLGDVELYQGNYRQARDYYTHVAAFAEAVGDRRSACIAQTNLGIVARELGQYDAALDKFNESLTLARAIGFPRGEGWVLCCLSLLYQQRGEHQEALRLAHEARTLFDQLGDRLGQAFSQTNLGRAYLGLRSWQDAKCSFESAKALRQTLRQPHLAIEVTAGLAAAAWGCGERQQALTHVEEILHYLHGATLEGTEVPSTIYTTCHLILNELNDDRAAPLWDAAQQFYQRRAAQLDGDEQQTYLASIQRLYRADC